MSINQGYSMIIQNWDYGVTQRKLCKRSRRVGDGLSYDFKLGCQLGSEKARVDVLPKKGIQYPRVDEVRVRVG